MTKSLSVSPSQSLKFKFLGPIPRNDESVADWVEPGSLAMKRFLVSLRTTVLWQLWTLLCYALTRRYPNDFMKISLYIKSQQTFSINILDFVDHMPSFEAVWFCHCTVKAATEIRHIDGEGCVPLTFLAKIGSSMMDPDYESYFPLLFHISERKWGPSFPEHSSLLGFSIFIRSHRPIVPVAQLMTGSCHHQLTDHNSDCTLDVWLSQDFKFTYSVS